MEKAFVDEGAVQKEQRLRREIERLVSEVGRLVGYEVHHDRRSFYMAARMTRGDDRRIVVECNHHLGEGALITFSVRYPHRLQPFLVPADRLSYTVPSNAGADAIASELQRYVLPRYERTMARAEREHLDQGRGDGGLLARLSEVATEAGGKVRETLTGSGMAYVIHSGNVSVVVAREDEGEGVRLTLRGLDTPEAVRLIEAALVRERQAGREACCDGPELG